MSNPKFFAIRTAIAKRGPALPTTYPLGAFDARIERTRHSKVAVRADATIVLTDMRIVATSYRVDKDALRTTEALVDGASITVSSDMFGAGRTTIDASEFPISVRLVASDSGYDAVRYDDPRATALPLAA